MILLHMYKTCFCVWLTVTHLGCISLDQDNKLWHKLWNSHKTTCNMEMYVFMHPVFVTLKTFSRLLNRSVSWPKTVVREFRRPFLSVTNSFSTAASMSRHSVPRQVHRWTISEIHQNTSRKTDCKKHLMDMSACSFDTEFVWWYKYLMRINMYVCGGREVVLIGVYVPGSLASIDSASSQTMSSLLLVPWHAEVHGLTSSMVLIRVMVSWRCGGKCKSPSLHLYSVTVTCCQTEEPVKLKLTWKARLAFSCMPKTSGSSMIGSPSMYFLYCSSSSVSGA